MLQILTWVNSDVANTHMGKCTRFIVSAYTVDVCQANGGTIKLHTPDTQ